MGQRTHALMLGAAFDSSMVDDNFEDYFDDSDFDGDTPDCCGEGDVIGYFVAIGREGDSYDFPSLGTAFRIDAIDTIYADALVYARAEWAKLDAFMRSKGVKLDPPGIYIVETEVG
jgi:hypothetical protein